MKIKNKTKSLILALVISSSPILTFADTVGGVIIKNNTDANIDYKLDKDTVEKIKNKVNVKSSYKEILDDNNGRSVLEGNQQLSYLIKNNIISRESLVTFSNNGITTQNSSPNLKSSIKKSDFLMGMYKATEGTINSRPLLVNTTSIRDINGGRQKITSTTVTPRGYSGNSKSFDYSEGDYQTFVSSNVTELYLAELLNDSIIKEDELMPDVLSQIKARTSSVKPAWDNSFGAYYTNKYDDTNSIMNGTSILGKSYDVSSYPKRNGVVTVQKNSNAQFFVDENIQTMDALKIIETILRSKEENTSNLEVDQLLYKIIYKYGTYNIKYFDGVVEKNKENKDSDRKTIAYLIYMGVLDFEEEGEFGNLYGDLTTEYAYTLLYRLHNKASRKSLNTLKAQDFLTKEEEQNYENGYVEQKVNIENISSVAESETISVTEGNHLADTTTTSNTTDTSNANANSPSGEIQSLVKASNQSKTYTVVKMFIDTEQTRYQGTRIKDLESSDNYKVEDVDGGRKVTFTINAGSDVAALACIDSRITITANTSEKKGNITTLTQISSGKGKVSNFISDKDLQTEVSDISIINSKTLMNRKTGDKAVILSDHNKALVGNTVIEEEDVALLERINKKDYYNLDVVVPLMTNSYISSIDPAKVYITVDLPKEETVPVQSTSGNTIETTTVAKLGTSLGSELNPLVDKTLDKYFFNLNLISKGVSTLIKDVEVGGTKAKVIINWSYTLPSNANDIRDISENDNNFSIADATKWLYRRPSSGTNGDNSLQDWWDNNIELSNSLANFMYGTEDQELISSGYMTPSIDILTYKPVENQSTFVNKLFKDLNFSKDYINKFMGGSKNNFQSYLFNKNGNSLAAVRRLNVYEVSQDANPKGIVSFSDRYVTYPTGAVYKAVDLDDRLSLIMRGNEHKIKLNTRRQEESDFTPNEYGNVKIYNPSNGSGKYVTMYYAGLSGDNGDGNYVRFTPKAGDEVSGTVYKTSDGSYSIKDNSGKDVIDSYTQTFLDVLPQGFVRQNIPANQKSFSAPVEEVTFGATNDPDASSGTANSKSNLGTLQQQTAQALSATTESTTETGNVNVDDTLKETFSGKAMGTQTIETSGSTVKVGDKTYTTKKKLNVVATAYTGSADENGGYENKTSSGKVPKVGTTIATDPTVIPTGSLVYIPALNGIFEAQDIGGGIKGNHVDVFMENKSVSSEWGRRNLDVYVLNESDLPNSVSVNGNSVQLNGETSIPESEIKSASNSKVDTLAVVNDFKVASAPSDVFGTSLSQQVIEEYANYDVVKYYIKTKSDKSTSSESDNKTKITTSKKSDDKTKTTTTESTPSGTSSSVSSLDGFVFIGDSYIYGIKSIVKSRYSNVQVYGKIGAPAYAYNNDTKVFGRALINNTPANSSNVKGVVVNIGVNNVTTTWSNPSDVKTMLKSIKRKYSGKPIYVVKTTPVGTNYKADSYAHTNQCIAALNKEIQAFCKENGINFIDATSGLVQNGVLAAQSNDGLHIASNMQSRFVSNIENAIVNKSNVAEAPEDNYKTVELKTMISPASSGTLDNFLFVGDSYIGGLKDTIDKTYKNCKYSYKVGASALAYNEDTSTFGTKLIDNIPKDSDDIKGIVLNLGVNNVNSSSNASDVQKTLTSIKSKYPNKPIYYLKVTNMSSKYTKDDYKTRNENINKLNSEMQTWCQSNGINFVDATSGLVEDGQLKYTSDGLHIASDKQDVFLDNIAKGVSTNTSTTTDNDTDTNTETSNDSTTSNDDNPSGETSSSTTDGTKVKTNHFSKAVGLTEVYYIIRGEVYKVKKTSTKYEINKVTDDSAVGKTAYAFPVVYLKRNEVRFNTLSNSTDDSKYKVELRHTNLFLQDSNVFFSGLNNSLITRLLDQETGASTLNELPSGAQVVIGDMKFTKTGKVLSSDPITDSSMVNSIYRGALNGNSALEKEVLGLFSGISITYSGRNSSEMAFTSFIKSAKLGKISHLADEQVNNTMYEDSSVVKLAKTKNDTVNMTTSNRVDSCVVAIATDDNILYRCIDKKDKVYELVTSSDRFGEGYIDNVSKFYETLNLDDSDDLYEAMQTNRFQGLENAKYYINKFMEDYRKAWISDSLIMLKSILIIIISYFILLSWVLYPILGKNQGRQFLIIIKESFQTNTNNGLDFIRILTFGVLNVESKLNFRTVFVCNIALFILLTLVFRSVGG